MTKKTAAKKPASKKKSAVRAFQQDRATVSTMDLSHGLYAKVDALCVEQDAAMMQILSIAKLAKASLDSDLACAMNDTTSDISHALAAILEIAAVANDKLDAALVEIGDERLRRAA